MKKMNIIPTPRFVEILDDASPLSLTTARIVGEYGERLIHALNMLGCQISKDSDFVIYVGEEVFPEELKLDTGSHFSLKNAQKQGYYLERDATCVTVAAHTEIGCVYGVMTLLEIISEGDAPTRIVIKDAPDFLYRGNKFLNWCECGMWSYDRGDGVEKYKERIIRQLDVSLRHKINLIQIDAFGWQSERFPGYNALMTELNREARKRGIHLLSAGYGMGYGLIGHVPGTYKGVAHMNRLSYPDGEIYKCIGTYDPHDPEDKISGAEYGTCLSNDALLEDKLSEIVPYLENTEMGALYIHNMDADYILPPLWKARCERCREKWPNDDLYAEDGCAGAFAYFIENLYQGICRARTECYDAARDCRVYIVSPGYMYMHAEEECFDIAVKFWQSVSLYLPHHENLEIMFREHYFAHGSDELRINKLCDDWKSCSVGVVDFCGGDGFYSDKLFIGGGLFLRLMKGVSTMLMENGNANQEPMQLYNAEYLWNSEASAFCNLDDIPTDYDEFEKYYIDYLRTKIRPEGIYGDGGLLEVACSRLYGKGAARDFAELYKISGEDGEPPLVQPCSCEIFTNFTRVVYPMRWDDDTLPEGEINTAVADRKNLSIRSILKKFERTNDATCRAAELARRIYSEKKYLPEREDDVKWLADNLTICSRYTTLLVKYMRAYLTVNAHFLHGNAIPDETRDSLLLLKRDADELLHEVTSSGLSTIDNLGGALARRDDIADFLSYNIEIMIRSIDEDVRMPSGRRPLRTRTHW